MRTLLLAPLLALSACLGSGGSVNSASAPAVAAHVVEEGERRFTQGVLAYGQAVDLARPLIRTGVISGTKRDAVETANRTAVAAISRGNATAEQAGKLIEADTLDTARAVICSFIPGGCK